MKSSKIKIVNILIFVAYMLFTCFQLGKFCIYASHRELLKSDYMMIAGIVECAIIFLVWFIFAMIYNSKAKFRIFNIISFIFCSVLALAQIFSKIKTFRQLFFSTDVYTPPFIDKFTSLFELCFIVVFAISFAVYFVILLRKKYFSKLS